MDKKRRNSLYWYSFSFLHIYSNSEKRIPEVYTYVSDMYYERPVWLKDSVLVIALDVYLGSDITFIRIWACHDTKSGVWHLLTLLLML